MPNQQTLDDLHRLIHINKDAEAGLRSAAETVKNSELESLFTDYAKQHAKFGADLMLELERVGGTVTETEAHAGAPRRGWLASVTDDIKLALSGHSPAALLASCLDGEDHAEFAYHDAADAHPSGQMHTLINKQWQQIQGFQKRLHRLVEQTKDGVEFQRNE